MNTDKITEDCLVKMFKAVGLNKTYTEILEYAKQDNWYWIESWTQDQEDKFTAWMDAKLKKKTRWNKKVRSREIGWFLVSWGWKVK